MNSSPILFREESGPPRFLMWPLIFLCAGIVLVNDRNTTSLSVLYIFTGTLSAIFVLEFMAVVIEITETEIQYRFSPFYRRRIPIAGIQHWEVRAYQSPLWSGRRLVRGGWWAPRHCINLAMKDGAWVTIIADHPEKLAHAIVAAKKMNTDHEVHSTSHQHPANS